jgi:uncharacterized membrane protein YdjX (TVP38/TMEM64 family)
MVRLQTNKNVLTIVILFLFLILAGSIFYSFKTEIVDVYSIIQILRSYPYFAPIIFILIYTLLSLSFVPTLPLNLAAGFIWGTLYGTILTLFGAGLGSLVAFYTARYFFKEKIGSFFKGNLWDDLNQELANKEWQVVAFTRFNPIFPFGPTSYFFGVTKIRVQNFIVPTIVCIMPAATAFSAIGASIEGFVLSEDDQNLYMNVMLASGLLVAVVCLRFAFKIYNKKNNVNY